MSMLFWVISAYLERISGTVKEFKLLFKDRANPKVLSLLQRFLVNPRINHYLSGDIERLL
jgi:hypothetical protein